MQRPKVHPVLLTGILSLVASSLLEWLGGGVLSRSLLQGFLDGLSVTCLYGYLLAMGRGWLRQS
ncbi:MAG: hypothetical protein ACK2U2_02695 [Anaerolineae bacterium]|jgi:hypothetical protein